MAAPAELVALACVGCGTPVAAEPHKVAWLCALCGQGLLLDGDPGLTDREVHFAVGIAPEAQGRPFWVAEGQLRLDRATYSMLAGATKEAQRFWAHPRRFFVPAFTCSVQELVRLGTRLLLKPPDLVPGAPAALARVTLGPQDVQAVAEFVVVSVEAERKDKVHEVDFSLELGSPELWVLP